jgi:ABC-2 type transport system permease protein
MTYLGQARSALRICYFNGVLPLWRQSTLMIAIFLTPVSFVFFLFVIAPRDVFSYGVVGGVLFTALFTGNGMLNDCAYYRLERQLQQVFVASPVRSTTFVLGMALSELAFTIPAQALFLTLLWITRPFGPAALAALLGVILLTWLMATTLGFMISTFYRQLREIWPVGTMVFSSLSVIPPVFYPIAAIPRSWQWVAFIAPSTFASQLAQHSVGLATAEPLGATALGLPGVQLLGLLGATALFGAAAAKLARWRER